MNKPQTPSIHTVIPESTSTATAATRTPSTINERSNRIIKELKDLSFYSQGVE